MPNPTRIVVWFDDGTWWEIDPGKIKYIFANEGGAASCAHHPPYQTPGPGSPVQGPHTGPVPPTSTMTAQDSGTCYYVNGMIFCP
jgi:hypothetical protein